MSPTPRLADGKRVLVAYEYSAIVRDAFRNKGFDAWSCDILPTEGNPEFHIQDDVLQHLDENWDLMVAHPPCTFICRNRARQNREEQRKYDIEQGRNFFLKLYNSNIPRICVENPVPSKMAKLPKYDQLIQPYQFGHDYSKKTCFWLKNLPPLKPTKIVKLSYITTKNGFKYTKGWYEMPRTSIARSRTFSGVAAAMVDQWGKLLLQEVALTN